MLDDSTNVAGRLAESQMHEAEWRIRGVIREMHHSAEMLTVLLGAGTVIVTDHAGGHFELRGRRTCTLMCEYFGTIVARDGYHPAHLVLGVEFLFAAKRVLVRQATLEEAAVVFARRLREPGGFALTRAQADGIAETLDSLRQRASQPARQP